MLEYPKSKANLVFIMPIIRFKDKNYDCPTTENLLESLNRQGAALPFSCCAGHCRTCLSKATQGKPPPASQTGLQETQKVQGYFLPCICKPDMDLQVEPLRITAAKWQSPIVEKRKLHDTVLRLRLQKPASFSYEAGQLVTFFHQQEQRCYALASLCSDPFLEFHIGDDNDAKMDVWLWDTLQEGDMIDFSDVRGDCFYLPNEQPLLLLATATGLAPIYGILRQAIQQQHPAPIHIWHSCDSVESLYYRDKLLEISQQYAHISYHTCVTQATQDTTILQGDMAQVLQQFQADGQHQLQDDWTGWRVYLSSNAEALDDLRLLCLQKGVRNMEIYADVCR